MLRLVNTTAEQPQDSGRFARLWEVEDGQLLAMLRADDQGSWQYIEIISCQGGSVWQTMAPVRDPNKAESLLAQLTREEVSNWIAYRQQSQR